VKLDWAEQVKSHLSYQSNQQKTLNNQDQDTNIGNKARKQCAINKALALNNISFPQVEYEAMVPSENSSQCSYYEIPLAYDINKPMEPKA